jgi:hypothetical protein
MRGYWLRILLGALGIFAVGMLLVTAVSAVKGRVRSVAKTSDPITIPLPFVPFRVGGQRLGDFERVVLNRDAPNDLRSVDLYVDVGNPTAAEQLERCSGILAAVHETGGGATTLHDAEFSCVEDDSTQAALEQFGEVHIVPGDLVTPLLVSPEVANDLRREMIQMRARRGGDSLAARAESIADEAERKADSISEAAGRMADSITRLHERHADSIRREAFRRADSAMRKRQK